MRSLSQKQRVTCLLLEETIPINNSENAFFTTNDQNEGDVKDFEDALQALQQDVLIGNSAVLTTLSNAADEDLIKHFRPRILIADEIGVSMEAELLIHLEMLIGVGDHQQLQPVVLSRSRKNPDDTMINKFAESMVKTLIVCVQQAGLRNTMFTECFRCTEGLEQPNEVYEVEDWFDRRIHKPWKICFGWGVKVEFEGSRWIESDGHNQLHFLPILWVSVIAASMFAIQTERFNPVTSRRETVLSESSLPESSSRPMSHNVMSTLSFSPPPTQLPELQA